MVDSSQDPLVRAILFDPLGYLHRRRLQLPQTMDEPGQRAIINDMLIAAYRLDSGWPADSPNSLTRQWLRHWHRLPQAAYLMGSQLLRAGLAWQGASLRLPSWARDFSAMPLQTRAGHRPQQAINHADLLAAGYGQLLGWSNQLPPALAQRLPLLFPPESSAAAVPDASPDPLLLTLALQYAQRHPHSPPACH
ncbi:hypothetical protein BI347_20115 [Chromobacterium sphagni]|uniref:Type III secretion apparatus protein OrgA/MxiK n=1 Tax=Chromobacterium sphagni TaxID=1903179 RepID=A0A1S1WUC9_9NEIS|nr:type III secretion apparatus protein OrgA/MxiK [Chromobacterium sphagni]OHX10895.1 hypothetical protein BI347_20115 [Chromobacterium sphagni]